MSFRGVFMLLWFDGNRLPSRNIPLSRGDLPVLQADLAFHKSSCLCDRAKANLNCCATATSSCPGEVGAFQMRVDILWPENCPRMKLFDSYR